MNYRPHPTEVSRGPVSLERVFQPHFTEPVWVREWRHQGRHEVGLRRTLREVRTLPGFGIDDPYEIRLQHSVLSSRTVADGLTLGEAWSTGRLSSREQFVRGVLEQLLLGLARLHYGLARVHGHICPENIRISSTGRASLWGFPTAQWDYSALSPASTKQEYRQKLGCRHLIGVELYRAPESKLAVESDVYSICRIAQELLRETDVSEELWRVLRAGTSPEPVQRPTLLGLAKSLNPETILIDVDIARGLAAREAGLKAYRSGRTELSRELWEEARSQDSLSAVVWNNLAVIEMAKGDFETALQKLRRAGELCTSHPLIAINTAHCHLRLCEVEAAEFWARRANFTNPGLSQPYVCLSLISQHLGLLELASNQAFQAVALSPKSPAARLQLARVYDLMGAHDNALVQWRRVSSISKRPPFESGLIDELREPSWGKIRSSYGRDVTLSQT